jgi:hypothetical protein
MIMEELDLLKKAWKKDNHSLEQVTELEIYKMLQKKSSSIVKWILIISILEIILWSAISIIFNTDDAIKSIHAEDLLIYLKVLTYINYIVVAGFVYCFYKNYTKISAITSTKQLMNDILRTRKTVRNYVWYNLSMIVIYTILGFIMAFVYNPKMNVIKEKIANDDSNIILIKIILILTLTLLVFIGIFWLFYRLLYGILLRKLKRNYTVLKKIDL